VGQDHLPAPLSLEPTLIALDMTGDGTPELAYQFDSNGADVDGGGTWRVYVNDPTHAQPGKPWLDHFDKPIQTGMPTYAVQVIDYNLDGVEDLLPLDSPTAAPPHYAGVTTWRPLLSTLDGFVRVNTDFTGPLNQVAGAGHFADLNGDGYQDALQFFPAAPLIGVDNPQWRYSLRSGTVSSALQVDFPAPDATDNLAFEPAVRIAQLDFKAPNALFVLDRDGDGRSDIFFRDAPSAELKALEIPDAVNPAGLPAWIMNEKVTRLFVDFNGDGLVDLLTDVGSESESQTGSDAGRLYLWQNTGRGFSSLRQVFANDTNASLDYEHALVVDANGDGRSDLLVPNTHNVTSPHFDTPYRKANALHLLQAPTNDVVLSSTFTLTANAVTFKFENVVKVPDSPPQSPQYTEYFPSGMTSQYLRTQGPRVLDADGDGLDDLVWVEITVDPQFPTQRNRTIRYKPHAKAGELPDHLTAVREGLNQAIATVAISYSSLAGHPEVYKRGSGCNRDHYNCAINPYHVVSKVERDAGLNGAAAATKLVSTYSYRKSITHKKSRRWLGFAEQRIETAPSDGSQAPTVTRHFYSNTDEQRDPRLEETWTYSTLPDGRWWLERYMQNWESKDTVLADGKTLTYDYIESRATWRYRFPSYANPDEFTPAGLDLELPGIPPLINYRHHHVMHDQVLELGSYGNVNRRRSFVGHGSYRTTIETDYLMPDTAEWLLSRPKSIRTYQWQANCGSYEECRAATERTTEIVSYKQAANGAATSLPEVVRNYHTAENPGLATETRYTYDQRGNVTHVELTGAIDEAGTPGTRERCVTYDPDGVFVHATGNALGHLAYTKTDPVLGVPLVAIDPNGRRTLFQYDQLGRPVKVRAPNGAEANRRYDAVQSGGSLLPQVENGDATGRVDRTLFNRLGRPISQSFKGFDGQMRVSHREFNAVGTLKRQDAVATPEGAAVPPQIEYAYDTRGRKLTQREPNEADPAHPYQHTWEYDDWIPPKVTYTDTRGHVTERLYVYSHERLLGRVTEAKGTPDETTRDYGYGPFGRLASTEMLHRPETRTAFTYDDRGNLLTSADPDRGPSSYRYNAFNELILAEDANGRQTRPSYDALGRVELLRVVQAGTNDSKTLSVTDYTYDIEPVTQDSEYGRLTRVQRDDYVSATADGDEQRTQVDYDFNDALGLLQEVTHTIPSDVSPGVPMSYRFHYDYDEFGRLRTVQYPRLAGQTTAEAGLSVDYDYAGTNGQLATIKSRQSGVANGNLTLWALNQTDAANRPRLSTTGDGISRLRQYDWRGALTYQLLQASPNDVCAAAGEAACTRGDLRYAYDGEGNLSARIDFTQGDPASGGPATELFAYDALDRLTAMAMNASLDTPWETWTYDELGNLKSNTYRGVYTYGDPARPLRVTQVAGGTLGTTRSYSYDARGNQTTRPGGTVVYNELNLPARLLNTSGQPTAQFLYGPGGERVRKVSGSGAAATITTYVGGLYEQVRRGNQLEHRFTVPGVAALPYTESAGAITKQAPRFLHADHQGSVDTVTADDAAGEGLKAVIKERRSYDAFGLKRNPSWLSDSYTGLQPTLINQGYTGHNDDPELGLIDMKGRLYDPTLARFLTADPLVPNPAGTQDWNPYAYVVNNPLKHVDPSGYRYDVAVVNGHATWVGEAPNGGGTIDLMTWSPLTWTGAQTAGGWALSGDDAKQVIQAFEKAIHASDASAARRALRHGTLVALNTAPGLYANGNDAVDNEHGLAHMPDEAMRKMSEAELILYCKWYFCADEVTIFAETFDALQRENDQRMRAAFPVRPGPARFGDSAEAGCIGCPPTTGDAAIFDFLVRLFSRGKGIPGAGIVRAGSVRQGVGRELQPGLRPNATSDLKPHTPGVIQIDGTVLSKVRQTTVTGRQVFQGEVDAGPTLARADAGRALGRGNDGGEYGGYGLPRLGRGQVYREWYHNVPGKPEVSGMRIVTGPNGEAWFTPDHYQYFLQIR
jgi:RHS repeat-associated protein